ncbi:MAG: hypothetical protein U5K70_01360 [Halodesulfurarchaeum sp.]|nr:hypothetical protein [Halodesulfurarchaeum sp.]
MSRKQGHGGSRADTESSSTGHRGGKTGNKRRRAGDDRSRRRNERGQYVERMSEEEIFDLLDRVPGPVIATTDVAAHFDSTTEGARRKLNDLCDADRLDRRKVGGTRVYWRTDAEGT